MTALPMLQRTSPVVFAARISFIFFVFWIAAIPPATIAVTPTEIAAVDTIHTAVFFLFDIFFDLSFLFFVSIFPLFLLFLSLEIFGFLCLE